MNAEPWMLTWPTCATVAESGLMTLDSWATHLPAPQTDVERAVLRRIVKRRAELAMAQLRQEAPEIAQKYGDLLETLRRVCGEQRRQG